ncbi:phage tail protein [Candidatus Dojkabacteria bacterium]|uniref:Phage tail protein n=1 Tax=Candidatus Dojkabacteria bacterium TaxID=2099670 RepID=A0A5C7JB56_9BACT|nr:MAG: phage tail protein [Candidatus Dojkabacteria bacterium]
MPRLRQIVSVTIHSIGQLPIRPDECKFKPSAFEREHHTTQNPLCGGYTEKPTPAELEVTLNDNAKCNVDYEALNNVTDENISIEYSDGTSYVMPNAFTVEPVEPDKGELKAKFMSNISEKV